MISVYSDVIQFRGNHYDLGYVQGELLKDSFILANREKFWRKPSILYNFKIDENEVKKMILSFAPRIWDELNGLSDALQMRMTDTILQFGGYYLEYGKSGCSIFTGPNFSCETMIMTPSPMKDVMFYINRQTTVMQRLAQPCKLPVVQMGSTKKDYQWDTICI